MSEVHSIIAADKQFLWHPFTPYNKWFNPPYEPLVIEKAQGCYLFDRKKNRFWDGNSSIWTTTHGHRHPRIIKAILACLEKIDHVSFLGNTHPWAVNLGQKLSLLISQGSANKYRVFFSDNGSTAVETAIKIAWQALKQRKEKERTLFLCLEGSYHGDTVGAMSVSSIPFQSRFKELLFDSESLPAPSCFHCRWNKAKSCRGIDARESKICSWECLDALKKAIEKNKKRLAALIIEPKIQGASGMWMHPEGYLKEAFKVTKEAGAFFIVDEVFSGMGRTGQLIASHKEDVYADFICLAKGLSGGTLPIAATLIKEEIFDDFKGGYEEAFLHGHSYTANPLACASALENLTIFEQENTLEWIKTLSRQLKSSSTIFWQHPLVGDVRVEGAVLAVEILKDKNKNRLTDSNLDIGWAVSEKAKDYGLVTRAIKNVLILVPPYCSSLEDIEGMVWALYKALNDILPVDK